MDPDEVIDLSLQLLAEGGYYDSITLNAFGKLPLAQRAIVTANLIAALSKKDRDAISRRHAKIEAAMEKFEGAQE
ncbi:MAG: hypothetical protein L0Y60_04325 [Beijerinckiaceae bacterium]|nr:hypothetical protein [Beijerinckiaceae bacterium]